MAYLFRQGNIHELPLDLPAIAQALQDPETFVWIDVTHPTPDIILPLAAQFELHPLAVEDALHAHQRAKVESYGPMWFVVMHSASLNGTSSISLHEIALFIGPQFVITAHYDPVLPKDSITERWELVPETWKHTSSSLIYVVFDYLVDSFGPLADEIDVELKKVRSWMSSGRPVKSSMLRRIFTLEEVSHEAYSAAMTLRDILPPFMHAEDVDDAPVGSPHQKPYFRDVHDHAVGIVERLSANRDLGKREFDIYHLLASQQQGAVARQLTIVSTIFLPLTFLTGFFGQNFEFLVKHIASAHAFYVWGIGSYIASVLIILLIVWYVARE